MIWNKRYLVIQIWFFTIVSVAWGQTKGSSATQDPLPTEAQLAIEKGLSAVKQAEWNVAIRYFSEARQAAPDSPVPLVNLGLAEAQLPGRELRAICWFEAYLALVPNAANAAAVRKKIIDLDVRAESTVQKMIGLLQEGAAKYSESEKSFANSKIASLLARSGDLDAAKTIVDQTSDDERDRVRAAIVAALAELGHFADAIKLADQIKSEVYKTSAYENIASAQIEAGLLSPAKATLDAISDSKSKMDYYRILGRLAEAEYRVGQRQPADTLLRDAKASIDKIADSADRERFLIQFAVAEYKTGQQEAGEALLQQIRTSRGDLRSSSSASTSVTFAIRMLWLCSLAAAANEIGQRQTALQLLREAEQAARAAKAANENFIPIGIINETYIDIADWDGAKALIWRQISDGGDASSQDNKDWQANHLILIAKAKNAMAYASARASSVKTLTDHSSSPALRAQAWGDYANGTMNMPLFTDFKGTLEELAKHDSGKSDIYSDTSTFVKMEDQVEVFVVRLKDTRDFQAKQITFSEK